MELIGAAVFVLFVIVAVIAIYEYVVTQRKLVDLDEKCADGAGKGSHVLCPS